MSDTITMDNAGRIVLPKPMRERFQLKGGMKLRIDPVGDHIELTPVDTGEKPRLKKKKGLLIVTGSGTSRDATKLLRAEREDREQDVTGKS